MTDNGKTNDPQSGEVESLEKRKNGLETTENDNCKAEEHLIYYQNEIEFDHSNTLYKNKGIPFWKQMV